ncbi:Sensor protein SrrB [compost metagenome]
MLDVSRIRTGKLSIRPSQFDLTQLVAGLVENFAAQAAAAGSLIEFKAEAPLMGVWDEFRIEQVVANLLTNALRYGARHPVRVRAFEQQGLACIEVRDQGIGISAQNQQRIFQQFERVASNPGNAGLGLGLYISEQIVLAHGGSIDVESVEGQGATFTVRLPL